MLNRKDKLQIIRQVAKHQNLPYFAIEKDWWGVQTLDIIFSQLEFSKHLLFKGGTSLSKAWHLFNRFSEDIDLALNREYLSFNGGLISKSQVKKLREKSFEFVTTTFYKSLQKAFAEKGCKDINFDFENLGDGDQDPVSILIYYPAIVEHSEYVRKV